VGGGFLLATVLGSGMAQLDGTVVNVALPRIGKDLSVGLSSLQWVITGYTLTLAAFLLLGGGLGDRYGRRKVFMIGVMWFAVASALCAAAPNASLLILARALQGVGGALLTPGSLAILQTSFHPDDRGRVIGAWSGLTGVASAVGPFVGGWLLNVSTWRWIFLLNLPLAAAVLAVSARHVLESRDASAVGRPDWAGGIVAAAALAALTYGLIEGPAGHWKPATVAALAVAVLLMAGFLVLESRRRQPMLPLGLFRSQQFVAANGVTFAMYGALSAFLFLVPVQLQTVAGYTPLAAGVSLLPPDGAHAFAVRAFGSPCRQDRAAAADVRGPGSAGRRDAAADPRRLRRQLPDDRSAGRGRRRARTVDDRRPAHGSGAVHRAGRERGYRVRGEQRRRPHCGAPRGRRAARPGRDFRQRLPRCRRLQHRFPPRSRHLRGPRARRRRAGGVDDPQPTAQYPTGPATRPTGSRTSELRGAGQRAACCGVASLAVTQQNEEFVEPSRDEIPAISRGHVAAMEATDDDAAWVIAGMHHVVLRTIGRRSGNEHKVALPFWADSNGQPIVVGSFSGAPQHPSWYLNLADREANPEVLVRRQHQLYWSKPEILDGDEYAAVWAGLTADREYYNDYQSRTDRRLPLVRLSVSRPA
jgi:deazaflavin-dependent oxidoreductase (nitroreductase family)